MPCLPRRFIAALLWTAIALLPVRGFASVMMPMLMSGTAPAVATAPTGDPAAAIPCHGAAQDASEGTADNTHTCSLCDLCHSGVAATPVPVLAMPVLHEAQPFGASPPAVEPRAPDGLFRPPRSLLV